MSLLVRVSAFRVTVTVMRTQTSLQPNNTYKSFIITDRQCFFTQTAALSKENKLHFTNLILQKGKKKGDTQILNWYFLVLTLVKFS